MNIGEAGRGRCSTWKNGALNKRILIFVCTYLLGRENRPKEYRSWVETFHGLDWPTYKRWEKCPFTVGLLSSSVGDPGPRDTTLVGSVGLASDYTLSFVETEEPWRRGSGRVLSPWILVGLRLVHARSHGLILPTVSTSSTDTTSVVSGRIRLIQLPTTDSLYDLNEFI